MNRPFRAHSRFDRQSMRGSLAITAVAAVATFAGCSAPANEDEAAHAALRSDEDKIVDSVLTAAPALDPDATGVETWSVMLVEGSGARGKGFYTVARGFKSGHAVVDLDLTASGNGAALVQPIEVSYVADATRVQALGREMESLLPQLDANDCRSRYAWKAVKAGARVLGASVASLLGCTAVGSGFLTWVGVVVCPAGLAADGYAAMSLLGAKHAHAACSSLPEATE